MSGEGGRGGFAVVGGAGDAEVIATVVGWVVVATVVVVGGVVVATVVVVGGVVVATVVGVVVGTTKVCVTDETELIEGIASC